MPNAVGTWIDGPERITPDMLRSEYPSIERADPYQTGGTSDLSVLIKNGFEDLLQKVRQLGFDPATATPVTDRDTATLQSAWVYHCMARFFSLSFSTADDSFHLRMNQYTARAAAAADAAVLVDGTGTRRPTVTLDR